jgi:hypothetical protein
LLKTTTLEQNKYIKSKLTNSSKATSFKLFNSLSRDFWGLPAVIPKAPL